MSLGPLVGPEHPIVVGHSAPPVSHPLRSPLARLDLFPPVHRLDSLGFMNQTICAVWTGDKSRFLSLCYRAAAPECCPPLRLTLAAPKKHRKINLFFIAAKAVSIVGMLRQLGVTAFAALP